MNRKVIAGGLVALLCLAEGLLAQDTPMDTTSGSASKITYTLKTVNYPNDAFTQLLGINNAGEIVGYHGNGRGGHPNRGFTLKLPNPFNLEDFPGAVQTQVTGVNDLGQTSGFYTDRDGVQHGFLKLGTNFKTVDYPGSVWNRLLALNSASQAIGLYFEASGHMGYYFYEESNFSLLTLPDEIKSSAQITGINNAGAISGYYQDTAGKMHGFLLTRSHLITLTVPGALGTFAYGLNNVGQVVGYYTDGIYQASGFVWSEGTGFQTVDDPIGGNAITVINSINDKGVIVGGTGFCLPGAASCDGFVGTP
jgi:uncharacterized membrane protein